ncbi:MAG: ACP S-malonyltransferase [Phycisphaerales bacterium JB065]
MSTAPVILCPGQGAQTVGMGKAWAEASADAARVFGLADEILGDRLGAKLSTLCFEGPAESLNRTDIAQPALYVAGVACFRAAFADVNPSDLAAAAGLSLGEYTALHIAGAFSFEDGLELVTLRGRAMQDAAEASDSGMVALIGADEQQANAVCETARGDGVLVPANFNASGQIVISGSSDACDRAVEVAAEAGLRATKLAVAGAFHSPLMKPAADRLAEALANTPIAEPACPVVSNVTATPHSADSGVNFASRLRELLVQQLTSPVRWAESCLWLSQNVSGEYHELTPNKVLSGLMRRIDRSIKVHNHDAPRELTT